MSSQKQKSTQGEAVPGRRDSDLAHVFAGTTSPRHVRVIEALLRNQQLAREQVDRIAGSSNGPDIIAALRRKGLNIPCMLRDGVDRDGRPCKTGEYSLTESDRAALAAWWRERADLIVASSGHHA